ncbi:hypothetical protein Tco_0503869 [Tanacetum coccineum]
MPTETELALEQTQQDVSDEVSINIKGLLSGIEDSHDGPSDAMHNPSPATQAGNPVKETLLKLSLPSHKSILTDSKNYVKMDVEVPGSSRLKDP